MLTTPRGQCGTWNPVLYEGRHEKTHLWGFRPGPTQNRLYNERRQLETAILDLGRRGTVLSM